MSAATMTLIGLYNWDNTLFDKLNVPEGLNKDTLVNNILLRSGEFEVMFSDSDFMKDAIGMFSDTWQPTFERWVKALSVEYDPLENYDRKEEWSDIRNVSETGSNTGSSSSTTSGTTSSTTTNKVSAYDAGDALTTRDQSQTTGSDGSSSSGTSSGTNSLKTNEGAKHDGRIHGNIGVTTSQQMLISELDLGYWNVYEKITDLFLTNFVIPVY